jgi:diguanylate cyclase (GGDEF)-like protein
MKLNRTTRALISLAVNCLLLIIAYFSFKWLEVPATIKVISQYIAYVFFVMGIFFGWWFNRSRVFFCSLTLMLSQMVLMHYIPHGMDTNIYYPTVLTIVSVYIPLNILVFSVLRERGIISAWGRMRFLFITIELLIGAWIVWYNDTDLLQLFNLKLIPINIKLLPDFSHVSLLLFLAALAYLFTRQAVTGKPFDAPFMGITIFSFAALILSKDVYAAAVMFALSGLLLVTVVIQASYSMAYLDELTGLSSRRALKEEMQKLGGKYAIAMLDIDHFKKFNDTHGHDVGDDVLKLVAACMKGVGGGGRVFRYGGEEFTILFPGKTTEEAIPYLEELREHIANRGFTKRSKSRPKKKPLETKSNSGGHRKLYLTVSIGAAERNEKYRTAEEVTTAADNALYRAKAKGRNCVCK